MGRPNTQIELNCNISFCVGTAYRKSRVHLRLERKNGVKGGESKLPRLVKEGKSMPRVLGRTRVQRPSKPPMGVSENVGKTPKPNGFADHHPYEKWLFHWGYIPHFQTYPMFPISTMSLCSPS